MEDNMFVPEFKGQYTQAEVDVLSMEVTPEIEAILNQMLMEKAMKEAVSYQPTFLGPDLERQLWDNIDLFEEYIELTKEREPLNQQWEKLRFSRSLWWSYFKEEMEAAWSAMDRFDNKLAVVAFKAHRGEISLKRSAWEHLKAARRQTIKDCYSLQEKRRNHTYSIYKKAMEATVRCSEFWKTPTGRKLNAINELRTACWNAIQELDVTFEDYNNLVQTEISPYWTTGDTEEVDTMELMCRDSYQTMELLEETHMEEMKEYAAQESTRGGYWNHREASISVYKAEYKARAKAQAQAMEEDYRDSLASLVQEEAPVSMHRTRMRYLSSELDDSKAEEELYYKAQMESMDD